MSRTADPMVHNQEITTVCIRIACGSDADMMPFVWCGVQQSPTMLTVGASTEVMWCQMGGTKLSRVTSLHVTAPDGTRATHELPTGRTTVGRATPQSAPDLVLEPDPYRMVSRVHCIIEYRDGSWNVTDNASDNGTLLRRHGTAQRVLGTAGLQHGDSVLILGDVTADGQALYWKLAFDDPFRTQPHPGLLPSPDRAPHLEYDWIQMKAFRVEGSERTEIVGLSPQSHKLIRFLADLSRRNNGSTVACGSTRLIHMMWGAPDEWPPGRAYDEANLRNIINATRRKIERDPASPQLLQLERNFGYRLEVRAPTAQA